jgi:hypothetical protein
VLSCRPVDAGTKLAFTSLADAIQSRRRSCLSRRIHSGWRSRGAHA